MTKRKPESLVGLEAEAYFNLVEAAEAILNGEPGRAVWRAVDAAGIASQIGPKGGLIGYDAPTGRGYKVIFDKPLTVAVRRVK